MVHAGIHRATGREYAVKTVATRNLEDRDLDALQQEMHTMAELQHPHLVNLHEIYETGSAATLNQEYYIVMELMRGCELFDRIVQKEYFNEKEARDICVTLFEAIAYCHGKHIAHRDLKPENLLLASNDGMDDSNIKIADFGFSKRMPTEGYFTMCGSPSYVAPEVLNASTMGSYNWQCDVWSLGVIVYILLGGYCPFGDGDDERTLYKRIKSADFEFHDQYWGSVSDDAKNFIRSLLQTDPNIRLTASAALQHPWMTAENANALQGQDLAAGLQALKAFNARRKFRAAVNTLIAAQKLTGLAPM